MTSSSSYEQNRLYADIIPKVRAIASFERIILPEPMLLVCRIHIAFNQRKKSHMENQAKSLI